PKVAGRDFCASATSTFAERRALSDLRSIGLNQIEPVVSRAGCQLPANLHVANSASEATNYNPNVRIRGRGSPGPFVAAMRAVLGEQGGPTQVIGRLKQRRLWISQVLLSMSLQPPKAGR